MTTFTTLSDVSLAQDKPVTQSIARAWRDNPLAIGEADATAPRITAKAINSQYFKVKRTTNQNYGNVGNVRLVLDTEVYDPDSVFDSTTNYRFQPTVAGLYLIHVRVQSTNINGAAALSAVVRKNNSTDEASGFDYQAAANEKLCADATTIVQMNGSSDYIEAFYGQDGVVATFGVIGEMWGYCVCET